MRTGIVLFDELYEPEIDMTMPPINPTIPMSFKSFGKSLTEVPDESEVKSYGLIPIEFDAPADQERDAIDVVMRRGVI